VHVDLIPSWPLLELAEKVIEPLPSDARTTDRLRVIVAAIAAADPLRFATSEAAVISTGRTLIATMVSGLPHLRRDYGAMPLAKVLWRRLTAKLPSTHDFGVLNSALILLADHDMAASTLAARVAASTRAHPYAVVSAGLAALDGPLHGAASSLAYALIEEAMSENDPIGTIADRLRVGDPIPGFGHALYPDGDPRASTLMSMLDDGPVLEATTRLADAMLSRAGVHPNIDLAVAALALQSEMLPDAGEAIFAVARTAGWLAHAMEEYADRPLRFRPVGQYSGELP
jgi:citrate synthase